MVFDLAMQMDTTTFVSQPKKKGKNQMGQKLYNVIDWQHMSVWWQITLYISPCMMLYILGVALG